VGENSFANSLTQPHHTFLLSDVEERLLPLDQPIIENGRNHDAAIPVPSFPNSDVLTGEIAKSDIGLIRKFGQFAKSSSTPQMRRLFERLTRALPPDDARSLSAFSDDNYNESFDSEDSDFFAGMGSVSGSIIEKLGGFFISNVYWVLIWWDVRSLGKHFPHNDDVEFDDMNKLYDLLIDITWYVLLWSLVLDVSPQTSGWIILFISTLSQGLLLILLLYE
jgi:hypothetical protein